VRAWIEVTLPVAMARRRMRITDVSRASGLPRTTVTAHYFGREKGITFDTLAKICRALDCGPGDVLALRLEGEEDAP
jgi:putative transcriptional regulator